MAVGRLQLVYCQLATCVQLFLPGAACASVAVMSGTAQDATDPAGSRCQHRSHSSTTAQAQPLQSRHFTDLQHSLSTATRLGPRYLMCTSPA